ncbi:MAG: Na/Pi cotransporter family protein [Castellaniella sp.]
MKELFALLDFGGYAALLLWGVHMVQSGVQRAFGARLGVIMGRALGTRTRAFLTGLGITAAIQSSTATGLMITSFAAGGMVALMPGLAAMLGANVGTTLIVQLLSFNLTALAPAFILVGVWMFRRNQPGRRRDLGRVFVGFGLLLLSLHELVQLLAPVQDAVVLQIMLDALKDQPIMAMGIAAVLSWAAHSSVSVVVIIMSLASHGLVTAPLACALVLGANLGSAINPVLETPDQGDPASRRLPLGNLGTRVVGSLLVLIALPWVASAMQWLSSDPARAVANFHTLFNIIVAALFLPVLPPYARLLVRLLPRRTDPDDPSRPMYLDDSAHEVPAIALGNAAREALRLADMLQSLLGMVKADLQSESRHRINHARYLDDAINQLESRITAYLATLDQENMTKEDHRHLNDILSFTTQVSRAASQVTHGLLKITSDVTKKGRVFSDEQKAGLQIVVERLLRNQRRMASLFVAEDLRSARHLAYEKDHFRKIEAEAAEKHLHEIKSGCVEHAETGSMVLDFLRDAKAVNSYLVEAAAYPILARHGELLPNRLRDMTD